jgi:hypothetical protein
LLKATNRLAEAKPLMRRALAILEATPSHPNLAGAQANYAAMRALLEQVSDDGSETDR